MCVCCYCFWFVLLLLLLFFVWGWGEVGWGGMYVEKSSTCCSCLLSAGGSVTNPVNSSWLCCCWSFPARKRSDLYQIKSWKVSSRSFNIFKYFRAFPTHAELYNHLLSGCSSFFNQSAFNLCTVSSTSGYKLWGFWRTTHKHVCKGCMKANTNENWQNCYDINLPKGHKVLLKFCTQWYLFIH